MPTAGAQFDVWTGAVLRGPATDPLKTYAVTVDGVKTYGRSPQITD